MRHNDLYTGIRKDGSTFPAEVSTAVIRDAAGNPEALMAVYRDISDRRRAEDAVRKTEAELLAAAEIQARLLPDKAPEVPGFDIAGHCYSAKAAAGDHFDFLLRSDGSLLVVLGDVSGHGLGPALVAVDFCARLRTLSETDCELSALAQKINAGLCQETESGVFVTAILGSVDTKTRSFSWINAGHPAAIVLDASGAEKARLESGSLPFALISELPFTLPDPLPLAAGDLIFLYTDGLTEAHRIKGPLLGLERVLETVRHHQAQPAAQIVKAVRDAACRHLEADKPKDDITLVVIKVLA